MDILEPTGNVFGGNKTENKNQDSSNCAGRPPKKTRDNRVFVRIDNKLMLADKNKADLLRQQQQIFEQAKREAEERERKNKDFQNTQQNASQNAQNTNKLVQANQNPNSNRKHFNHNSNNYKNNANKQENQNQQTNQNQQGNQNRFIPRVSVQEADVNDIDSTVRVSNWNLPKIQKKRSLKVMFLGGVGEIGKNMMVVEYDNDIIVIDVGSTFPSVDGMPGIDLVVPDITYLLQNKDRIRGIVITHAHEDHIGAIPYVLDQINATVYGSKLTMALIENKLQEFPKIKAKLQVVNAREEIHLGCFTIEFIPVTHSIAGAMALAITSPAGVMVHTGDFKIDFTPIDDVKTDLTRFAELGSKGVLLLTAESTNVEREGFSMSERNVGKTLNNLFEKYKDDRLIVATFASNINRLQELMDLAQKYKRKVSFTGRSMVNITETAYRVGALKFDKNLFVDLEKIGNYKDSEILIVSTGSQGEPMSALTRMANGEFPKLKLGEHDTIIISASPIPGNEKMVNNVINGLYKLGCNVIYHSLAEVHVSGHAYKEELKIIHQLVKPKFFIPVHGEYRHLKLHKDLAVEMGMDERNVLIAEIGSLIEVNKTSMKLVGTVPAGSRLVDGLGVGDLTSFVLRDRKQLAEDGLAVVVLGMSGSTGEITNGPDIITRGLIYSNEMEDLTKEAKQVIVSAISDMNENQTDWNLVKNNVRKALANFFYKKTKRRPMVLTIVLEY